MAPNKVIAGLRVSKLASAGCGVPATTFPEETLPLWVTLVVIGAKVALSLVFISLSAGCCAPNRKSYSMSEKVVGAKLQEQAAQGCVYFLVLNRCNIHAWKSRNFQRSARKTDRICCGVGCCPYWRLLLFSLVPVWWWLSSPHLCSFIYNVMYIRQHNLLCNYRHRGSKRCSRLLHHSLCNRGLLLRQDCSSRKTIRESKITLKYCVWSFVLLLPTVTKNASHIYIDAHYLHK